MKILIEKNVKTFANGRVVEYYRVKYNRGFWWPFWQYVQQHHAHSDPDIKDFDSLDEAKRVAKKLAEDYTGPQHVITDLDIHGEPTISGGWSWSLPSPISTLPEVANLLITKEFL